MEAAFNMLIFSLSQTAGWHQEGHLFLEICSKQPQFFMSWNGALANLHLSSEWPRNDCTCSESWVSCLCIVSNFFHQITISSKAIARVCDWRCFEMWSCLKIENHLSFFHLPSPSPHLSIIYSPPKSIPLLNPFLSWFFKFFNSIFFNERI